MQDQKTNPINDEQEEKKTDYMLYFIYICFAIVTVCILYYIIGMNYENRGTFGDMFGGLNAAFSGFAFAGVIITIVMQMKELELTRKELHRTAKAQEESADAQEESQKALHQQLREMQAVNKIEILNSYINAHPDKFDEVTVAKMIIEEQTLSIFNSASKKISPNFNLLFCKIISKNNGIKWDIPAKQTLNGKLSKKHADNGDLVVKLQNIGSTAVDVSLRFGDNWEVDSISYNYHTFEKGATIFIVLDGSIEIPIHFKLRFRCPVLKKTWVQNINFTNFQNSTKVSIESPILFEDNQGLLGNSSA